jgi:hypothetical protein
MDDAMRLLLVHTILQNASNRLAYTSGNKFLSGLFRYASVTSIHSPTNLLGGTGNPASCKSASHNLVFPMKNNSSRVAWMREPAIMERAFESREFSAWMRINFKTKQNEIQARTQKKQTDRKRIVRNNHFKMSKPTTQNIEPHPQHPVSSTQSAQSAMAPTQQHTRC